MDNEGLLLQLALIATAPFYLAYLVALSLRRKRLGVALSWIWAPVLYFGLLFLFVDRLPTTRTTDVCAGILTAVVASFMVIWPFKLEKKSGQAMQLLSFSSVAMGLVFVVFAFWWILGESENLRDSDAHVLLDRLIYKNETGA